MRAWSIADRQRRYVGVFNASQRTKGIGYGMDTIGRAAQRHRQALAMVDQRNV